MSIVNHQNNFSTNPTSAVSATDTTTPLDDIPTVAAPFYLAFDATNASGHYEIVYVTSKTATNVNHAALTYDHGTSEVVRMIIPAEEADVFVTTTGTETLSNKTLSGSTLFDENAYLQLDSALSADGKYCGIVEAGTAGATLAFGDLCYFAVADSRWELVDADTSATAGPVKLGICVLAAASDGDATKMLLWGKVRADANFPTLTVGAPVYVSTGAGNIQVAQPSGADDIIRVVGYGNTADELFFCPSPDYITHI